MIFLLKVRLCFWELFTYGRFRPWASLALDRASLALDRALVAIDRGAAE